MYFNPIIVLFLTKTSHTYYTVNINFNPIIVLFLTHTPSWRELQVLSFQSYYSLIFNSIQQSKT